MFNIQCNVKCIFWQILVVIIIVSGLFYREIITGLILSVLDLKSTGIKNKEEEVSVSRKRHPNSKHLLPALQAAPEHPHENIMHCLRDK